MSKVKKLIRRPEFSGILFASPWFIGFLVLGLFPIAASLFYSLSRYNVVRPPTFIGTANYQMLFQDTFFWRSLWNTFYLLIFGLPLQLLTAFLLALLLNSSIRGKGFFRTVFYLPAILPIVATAILWLWILNPRYGLINSFPAMSATMILRYLGPILPAFIERFFLGLLDFRGPGWLADPNWSKPGLILMNLWLTGTTMVIFLAALQQVPKHLYEAAMIDGANDFRKILYVTIPSIKPVILFNTVMGVIATFQYFTQVYVMTTDPASGQLAGGPEYSTLVYPLYLYQNAFQFFRMGYASAMAWIMFLIIGICIWGIFKIYGREV